MDVTKIIFISQWRRCFRAVKWDNIVQFVPFGRVRRKTKPRQGTNPAGEDEYVRSNRILRFT